MRNIALLSVALSLLLILTWVMTESGIWDKKTILESKLEAVLKNPTRYQLPLAQLEFKNGFWQSSQEIPLRAELLEELHRSLESIRISRVISSPPDYQDFFSQGSRFVINDVEFLWGDLSATGDSFYLGLKDNPDVYVVDLTQLGSLAVGDSQNVLLHAKYQRLRDLLHFPEHGWQERRLFSILRIPGFKIFEKGPLRVDSEVWSKRPWGGALKSFFISALHSLEVMGEIRREKPQTMSLIEPWVLTFDNGETLKLEFFPHPDLAITYVWIESLQRAYPLNPESSEVIQTFPERVRETPFALSLNPNSSPLGLTPELSSEKRENLEKFFNLSPYFDLLTLTSDCSVPQKHLAVSVEGVIYHLWRREESWVMMDCEAQVQWLYRIPRDSVLDFSMDFDIL
jgi:hypothetical protein